ncbi:excisionase family DNA-binding protein [uncultured Dysosmobacter sp.]|nr:excisionase family DNA-binding protein [uncultured Dysosmobacter sp.]
MAETLNTGRNKIYALISSGAIKALRIGNHYRIPREAFIDFLKSPNVPA